MSKEMALTKSQTLKSMKPFSILCLAILYIEQHQLYALFVHLLMLDLFDNNTN